MKATKNLRAGQRWGRLQTARGRKKIRAKAETDTKMGMRGALTNQKQNISQRLYKGTEMNREVKRAPERPGGIM